jgi:hypothetical protein
MVYSKGDKVISLITGEVFTVVEDRNEGSIRCRANGLDFYVPWDRIRKLTKLDLALR